MRQDLAAIQQWVQPDCSILDLGCGDGALLAHLRGSRTPDRVVFRSELPTNATGKVLRRELVEQLSTKESA